MDASDFMALKAFEPIADDPNFHARYDYLERFAAAVGGMHSRINMMVFEGLSTGFITADAQKMCIRDRRCADPFGRRRRTGR